MEKENRLYQTIEDYKNMPINKGRIEGGIRINKGIYKKSNTKSPLLSFVTAVRNGERYIEDTIKSIICQTHSNFEYIIIDGGSNDMTLDIIKKYEDSIDYWLSEPDKGISDAFNKGVLYSLGDYINFQGAGDVLLSKDVAEKIMEDINISNDIIIGGRIRRVSGTDSKKCLYISSSKFNKRTMLFHMPIPHQALFMHKDYFKKHGLFDLNLIYSMDYELLLRSYHNFPKVIMKDILVSGWLGGGIGEGKTLEIYDEYHKNKIRNKIASTWILLLINIWLHLKYYIKCFIYKIL